MANEIHIIEHTQSKDSYGVIVDGDTEANRYFLRMDEMRGYLLEVQLAHPDLALVNGYVNPKVRGTFQASNALGAEDLGKLREKPEKARDPLEYFL